MNGYWITSNKRARKRFGSEDSIEVWYDVNVRKVWSSTGLRLSLISRSTAIRICTYQGTLSHFKPTEKWAKLVERIKCFQHLWKAMTRNHLSTRAQTTEIIAFMWHSISRTARWLNRHNLSLMISAQLILKETDLQQCRTVWFQSWLQNLPHLRRNLAGPNKEKKVISYSITLASSEPWIRYRPGKLSISDDALYHETRNLKSGWIDFHVSALYQQRITNYLNIPPQLSSDVHK